MLGFGSIFLLLLRKFLCFMVFLWCALHAYCETNYNLNGNTVIFGNSIRLLDAYASAGMAA
jgi:hypothetical protein